MKKQFYHITTLMLAVCAMLINTSCNDELSELPSQYKVDGNTVVDAASAETLLGGMYYAYANSEYDNYDILSTGNASLTEVYLGDFAGTATYYRGAYMFETHNVTINGMYSYMFWNYYYTYINAANCVIEQVEAADDSWFSGNRKQEILGEAYAMRALGHYNLMRLFGYSWDVSSPYGVVLRTAASKVSNLTNPRSSVADSYAQILSDLDYAIENAPSVNTHWYISKWFAKGLKARVLMLRGQGNDYSDAAALAQEVINSGQYVLEDNVVDVFHSKGIDSDEVIFGLKPYSNQTAVYEAYYYRSTPQFLPTDNLLALFENDPRKDQIFLITPSLTFVWNDDGSYSYVYVDQYAICKHLDPTLMTANDIEESQYEMRLTEMYLLRAEALARTGNLTEAKSLLKTVLTHAGVTDMTAVDNASSQHDVLQQIFNEDMRNLFCEDGHELDFMLRFGDIATTFNPVYATTQYNVMGIPVDEFNYNGDLNAGDQNPGYSAE